MTQRKLEIGAYLLIALVALVGTNWALVEMFMDRPSIGDAWDGLTGQPIALFVTVNLLAVGGAALIFMVIEVRRLRIRWWGAYVAVGCLVAISVGFPLFLAARRMRLDALEGASAA